MHVLEQGGGFATSLQLRTAGARPRELTEAIRNGLLLRPRRGVYALPGCPPESLLAVRAGGRLSCLAAARSYGLWGGVDRSIHVRVPANSTRLTDVGAILHWQDAAAHSELWRLSLADCLRSVVACAEEEDAIAVLDTALSTGKATVAGLARLFANQTVAARRVAAGAKHGSDSGIESLARQRLEALGHFVEQQVFVEGVGRVDLRIDRLLYVELDGFAFHAGRESFENDRRRDAALAMMGARRLRISAAQVLEDWGSVQTAVERVLAAPEYRPLAPL